MCLCFLNIIQVGKGAHTQMHITTRGYEHTARVLYASGGRPMAAKAMHTTIQLPNEYIGTSGQPLEYGILFFVVVVVAEILHIEYLVVG